MELESQQVTEDHIEEVAGELPAPETTGEAEAVVPEVPAYTPNLKYSVGNEEKEFPELFKEFVKSEEHEKMLRELYTKADGLDHIKTKRDEYQSQLQELQTQVGEVVRAAETGDLQSVMRALDVDTRDLGKLMTGLGISKQQLLEHAYQLAQLTPEQEHAQNQMQQLEREKAQLSQQRTEYEQRVFQQQVHAREAELQNALSSQEISGIAQQFDKALGRPGAFRAQVVKHAQHAAHYEGRDLSVGEAIEEVLQLARLAQAKEPQAPTKPKMEVPPVIPTVPTGGSAPVKRKINSVEDLEAYAATLPRD